MCLGEVGRVVSVDATAGIAAVDTGDRVIVALLVALDDGGARLRAGTGVLVHLGLVTEVLDEATTIDLVDYRRLVRAAADPPARPSRPPEALP